MKFFYLLLILTIVFAKPEQSAREARQTKDYEINSFSDTDNLYINPDNPFLQEYFSNNPQRISTKRKAIITPEDEDLQDKTFGKTLYLSPTIEETLRRRQLEKAKKTSIPIEEANQENEEEINPGRTPFQNTQFNEPSTQQATRKHDRNQQSSYNIDNQNESLLENSNSFNQIQYTRFPINSQFQTNSNNPDNPERQYTRIPLNSQQFLIPNNPDNSDQSLFPRIPITSQPFPIKSNNPDNNAGVLQFLGGNTQGGASQTEQESANILESIIRNTLISGTDAFLGGILNANRNNNQQETSLGGNRIVLPTRITQRPTTNFFPTSQEAELFVTPSRVVTTQQIVRRPERIIGSNNIAFPQEQRVQLFDV